MRSPIPLDPHVMCCLCYNCIYDGEHWIDSDGQKWDTHAWCHLMDGAHYARKEAAKRRQTNNQPCIED